MRRLAQVLLLVFFALAGTGIGEAHPRGPHGGILRDLGPYRGELVVTTNRVDLFLTDRERRAVDARALRGNITFFKGSVRHGNVLSASGKSPTEPGVEAVVVLWLQNGSVIQARFPRQ